MNKKLFYILLLIPIIILTGQLISQIENAPAYEIIGLKHTISGSLTTVTIQTSRKPEITHQQLTRPPRLVVDFINARIRLPRKDYFDLPPGIVMYIRTSQFQEKPVPISRFVLDLAERTTNFNVIIEDNSIKIALVTTGYPNFPEWKVGEVEKTMTLDVPQDSQATTGQLEIATTDTQPGQPKPGETTTHIPVTISTDSVIISDSAGVIEIKPPTYMRPELNFVYMDTIGDSIIERRDPFLPVNPTKEMTLGKPIFPDVERVEIVGIVEIGGKGHTAILQDNQGFGYIMSVGDSVQNGKLVEITSKEATFIIEEFGWTRSITLTLPEEKF
ncbi:AMIN domain-containing protein [bacterium]|nr:AMIN domain-containing protein [bacterium]